MDRSGNNQHGQHLAGAGPAPDATATPIAHRIDHDGPDSAWDNVNLFRDLCWGELFDGLIHLDDICGTFILGLIPIITHGDLKDNNNALCARIPGAAPIKDSGVTDRWEDALRHACPNNVEYEEEHKRICKARRATYDKPRRL
ncbi:hypothetical protein CLAFUW4_11641 [Fulvia fulva]|uniref:Uncharacterized protein n=1 Tax=Passalora fulva TaxID=5499 RepID=A0A9Q8PCQ4_PASFU|nr:uncharacterized protein CLAFUR5_10687 [Fulvia fulva]KAK4619777.1 hypothetical protein CLAFUR4_11646 [Fulvia fulva]KAK4620583.1 hypothetical protein CLAFUR0_11656 [Fulvia fulva]UJO20121.1 hypothetical protein CLAFUR5_10687 [Fulvia fulva]WPV17378.1 hypothetical protein CLAFUW4_11641 [Fulvia fulva]WPV32673.1 hypothetical protein CLAFUW7_11646 [Fulvia fulva]